MTDHFMTLGGDSLAAVILLFKLEEKYEIIDWKVEDIYDTLTIEKLVKKIDDYLAQEIRMYTLRRNQEWTNN